MRLDTSFSGSGLAALAMRDAAPPAPTFTIGTVVIEGDSITQIDPNLMPSGGHYGGQFLARRPQLTVIVRAQASRTIGTAAQLDDGGNWLMGHVAEDMAYQPDLVTVMIGANDLTTGNAAAYRDNLIAWYGAVKAARPECRIAWSAPVPYNPDQSHVSYANFTAQRALLMADARDPAVWGQWADYYLPLAEHPDWFAEPPVTPSLWSDGVHLTGFDEVNETGGQNRLYDQFEAAVNTIADASRAGSTAPYDSVWPASEAGLAPGVPIRRRFVISGIAHGGIVGGVSVAGGNATVALNGASPSDDTTDASNWLYNGDMVELALTPSSSHDAATTISLTIGSETRERTYTTGADVAPVTYLHGGVTNVQPGGTVHTFSGLTFEDGLAVLGICGWTNDSVALTPSAGGASIEAVQQFTQSRLEVWTAPIAAGTYDVVVTASGWRQQTTLSYGTVQRTDPVPAQVVSSRPSGQSAPHLTPAVTVPTNGLALAFFGEDGGATITPATANAPTVLIDEGSGMIQGETLGIAVGSLIASGQASFQFAFGTHARGALVFAPEAP